MAEAIDDALGSVVGLVDDRPVGIPIYDFEIVKTFAVEKVSANVLEWVFWWDWWGWGVLG